MVNRQVARAISLAVGGSVIALVASVPVASADTTRKSEAPPYKTLICNAGGFTGVLEVYSTAGSKTVSLDYIINKGSNKGGNSGNVDVTDTGVLPAKKLSTSSAIQDGKEHGLGGSYNRGSGTLQVKFTFDKSSALDPSCTTGLDFGPRY